MIAFDNTQVAFAINSNYDLKRARLLFTTISWPFMVKVGESLLKLANSLRVPVSWAIKPSIFRQFVGGETLDECAETVERLNKFGVQSILDYSVEAKDNEDDRESAMNEILKSISHASKNSAIPFVVFKPSGIADTSVLEKVSCKKELSTKEQELYRSFFRRVETLCQAAFDSDKPILIDAEDSWYQAAIDEVVEKMMARFNKTKAIVYNTLQMYRTDRLNFLFIAHKKAIENGYVLGIKLVRGAYMEKERLRADELGYISPIHETKANTDRDFNEAVKFCIVNIDSTSMFCGTHNEDSVAYAAMLMERNRIQPSDSRIFFSQLFGMSDNISFNLAASNYNVAKYIPYGPVKEVLPYLIRRAQENTSVKGQTGRELSLIRKELKRRNQLREK